MTRGIGRREFVEIAGAAGAALAFGDWQRALAWQGANAPGPDAAEKDLVLIALDAVHSAGAGYADVRITRGQSESVSARERQITGVSKSDTYGIGIRALVGGSWGFAATHDLSRGAVARTAREAAAIAAANDRINPVKTVLAPVARVPYGRWMTPHTIDPFTIPIEERAQLLFKTNQTALGVNGVRFVTSSITAVKESRLLGTTDGSIVQQTFLRMAPSVNVTATSNDGDFQTRNASLAPMAAGWEYVVGLQMPEKVLRWAEEAMMKLRASRSNLGSGTSCSTLRTCG